MRINELKQRLGSLKIDRNAYCLDGGLPNEAYTINQNIEVWEVYYSEKGNISGLKLSKPKMKLVIFFFQK